MKKFVLGFIFGFVACAIVLTSILLIERRNKYEYGHKNGNIAGRFEAADVLGKEFGLYDGRASYKVLFSVKTTDVISIETNGIKTVRVIP